MSAAPFASFFQSFVPTLGVSLAARTLTEILVLIGAVLLVAIAVMIWAVAFRKKRKRTRLYHRHHRSSTESSAAENSGETTPGSRRRQRRERPRNPTLAETGGLPPVRRPPTPPTDFPY